MKEEIITLKEVALYLKRAENEMQFAIPVLCAIFEVD